MHYFELVSSVQSPRHPLKSFKLEIFVFASKRYGNESFIIIGENIDRVSCIHVKVRTVDTFTESGDFRFSLTYYISMSMVQQEGKY